MQTFPDEEAWRAAMDEQAKAAQAQGGPVTSNDHDRVMRLIRARCGDVLTDADLAALGDAAPDPDAGIPVAIADKVVEVLEAMEARLITLERARAA
jgi:hypothetical protein